MAGRSSLESGSMASMPLTLRLLGLGRGEDLRYSLVPQSIMERAMRGWLF